MLLEKCQDDGKLFSVCIYIRVADGLVFQRSKNVESQIQGFDAEGALVSYT